MNLQSYSRRVLAVAGAVLAVSACGGASSSNSANQTANVKIMVGGLNKQIYLPNMLTQQLGYFKEQNVNVTFIDEGSGQGAEQEVVAGNVAAGSGSYNHTIELQAAGKNIETVCQFGIAPGEAEVVDAKKASSITSIADLKGKNLGVTDLGSGTQTVTSALLGQKGVPADQVKWVAVGAGNTFIAAINQQRIDAGMTTEPTISRLVQSGQGKVLVDLRTPAATRAALGGDYPFIGVFMRTDYVGSHRDVTQRLVNAYTKTLKWMHSHTAAQIADKMPADYYAGDKALYVQALQNQLQIFGSNCKMPAGGPENVLKIEQNFVSSFKGKTADVSKTYTNEFANKAAV
ncbi:MAG: ABC transporter substrate-binding protein [Candidatus Dormibacteraeota bacterium]|nr:ABC transporter substrate-binding protein [Candidatus Dormibacteraeota bacterium]